MSDLGRVRRFFFVSSGGGTVEGVLVDLHDPGLSDALNQNVVIAFRATAEATTQLIGTFLPPSWDRLQAQDCRA